MPFSRNDCDLIDACLRKDQKAWRELVDRYTPLVYSIALRRGLSKPDAEEVFQEVFTTIYRRLNTLRNQRLIAAWMIRITYRHCSHLHRRSHETEEIPDTLSDPSDPAEEEVETWERRHLVRLSLDQMGSPCRELLHALFLDWPKPNYEQIAKQLGIAVGSIGPSRTRCFKKLQAIMIRMGVQA